MIYSGDSRDKSPETTGDEDGEIEIVSEVTEGNSSDLTDCNNNAQRMKSVVVETTTHSKTNSGKATKRITVTQELNKNKEPEEGELSSSDNGNWDSFVEQADDQQFAAFLERHRARIDRLTGKQSRVDQPSTSAHPSRLDTSSGEENHLAINIRRMSLKDKQSSQTVRNSQSEDTIYTQLVRERNRYEQNLRDTQSDLNRSARPPVGEQANDVTDSNESSLNESGGSPQTSSLSTDETDKNIVMDKFVNSPNKEGQELEIDDQQFISDDEIPTKRRKKVGTDKQPHKRKISVAEYSKRKQREEQIEREWREKADQQRRKNKDFEDQRAKARDHQGKLAQEDDIRELQKQTHQVSPVLVHCEFILVDQVGMLER